MSQLDFWSVRGLDGRTVGRTACVEAVNALETRGRYILKQPLRFGPGMGHVLALSIGTESLRAAVFDANGEIATCNSPVAAEGAVVGYHAAEAPPKADQLLMPRDMLLDRVALLARQVLSRAAQDEELLVAGRFPLIGIAAAWPTPLNRWTKVPGGASLHDPAWRTGTNGTALGVDALVADRLGVPRERSHALNDANAIALAAAFDRWRAGPAEEGGRLGGSLLGVRIGGGLGMGTVVVGELPAEFPRSPFLTSRLLEGAGGYAGELGHWQVPPHDVRDILGEDYEKDGGARRCTCGKQQCLETYASASAFEAWSRRLGIAVEGLRAGKLRAKTSVMHEVMSNVHDVRHIDALESVGRLIGRSLSAPVLLLSPEAIVLSGSLAIEPVKRGIEFEKRHWRHFVHGIDVSLHMADRESDKFSAARGAALAVLRGQIYRRFDDETIDLDRITLRVDPAATCGPFGSSSKNESA